MAGNRPEYPDIGPSGRGSQIVAGGSDKAWETVKKTNDQIATKKTDNGTTPTVLEMATTDDNRWMPGKSNGRPNGWPNGWPNGRSDEQQRPTQKDRNENGQRKTVE